MLGRLNEKKALIMFASGLNLNGLDNQAQMVATEQAAIRAGVSFWPIDSRGLVAQGPLGDATQGSPGGSAMYTGGSASALTTRFAKSQDTLYALAGDTGGKALLDNNDLDKGIWMPSTRSRTITSWATYEQYDEGREVPQGEGDSERGVGGQPGLRQGYFGEKEWGKFNNADKERQQQ